MMRTIFTLRKSRNGLPHAIALMKAFSILSSEDSAEASLFIFIAPTVASFALSERHYSRAAFIAILISIDYCYRRPTPPQR